MDRDTLSARGTNHISAIRPAYNSKKSPHRLAPTGDVTDSDRSRCDKR